MLCGHPPFRGNKEEDIKNKILSGRVDFPQKEFEKVSPDAIKFIKDLLDYAPNKRPTCEEALSNKWLTNMIKSDSKDNILDQKTIQNLVKFQSVISLQKASLAFIANQLGHSEEIGKIKDEFDKIDVNKDGVLSREELLDCKINITKACQKYILSVKLRARLTR